jgi:hypothetical protein
MPELGARASLIELLLRSSDGYMSTIQRANLLQIAHAEPQSFSAAHIATAGLKN